VLTVMQIERGGKRFSQLLARKVFAVLSEIGGLPKDPQPAAQSEREALPASTSRP